MYNSYSRLFLPILCITLLYCCFSPSALPAQCWNWQSPQPHGYTYDDLFFVDTSNGWRVGRQGTAEKTSDGGNSWIAVDVGTSADLYNVFFVDPNVGWISGSSLGTIYKTTDGGASWQQQSLEDGSESTVGDLFFLDAQRGWAASNNQIYYTEDGGASWMAGAPETGTRELFFLDALNGWSAGGFSEPNLARTTDGGRTWESVSVSGTDGLDQLFFVDSQHGWTATSNGTIFRTTNGGTDWTRVNDNLEFGVSDLFFIDDNTGWAVGSVGHIQKTTDGGQTWVELNDGNASDLSSDLSAVFFTDAQNGWVVGTAGAVSRTSDGGQTWTVLSGSNSNAESVFFLDENVGWAVVGRTILKTTNGGTDWSVQHNSGLVVNDVFFVDSQTGWYVGSSGVYRSTDGGATWARQLNPSEAMVAVHFVNSQIGWVSGQNGAIYKTTDGGNSWLRQSTNISDNIQSLFFRNAQLGWATAGQNTILITPNGGATWNIQIIGPVKTINPRSVFFVSDQVGFVAGSGDAGPLLKSTDGGTSWDTVRIGPRVSTQFPFSEQYTSIHFVNEQVGWVVGTRVLKTEDGGNYWFELGSGSANFLTDVFFVRENKGWAVGFDGTILHYDVTQIPFCNLTMQTPAHQETDVTRTPDITWTEPEGCVAGYVLRLGTSSGASDLLDTTLYGLPNYQVVDPLPYDTEVFVNIMPFNCEGTASGCQEFTFTTEALNCATRDSLTLTLLYEEWNGASWEPSKRWDLLTPIATWFGVQQDMEGCVTELILPDLELTGTIPEAIADLEALEMLHLFNNNLQGSIPTRLGDLMQLRQLYLYENQLSGAIPSALGNLSTLEELLLYRNNLDGTVPTQIGNLSNLTTLLLYENQLDNNIPPELGNLDQLQILSLGENNFNGSIPTQLGNLSNLKELYLYTNNLEGVIPASFSNLVNLQIFTVGSNALTGAIPAFLGDLSSLRELYLYENQFTGPLPPELAGLSQLSILQLNNNLLEGCFPMEYEAFCGISFDFSQNDNLIEGGDFPGFCAGTLDNFITTPLDTAICEGNTLQIADTTLTTAGQHQLLLPGMLNCDTILDVNLTIHPIEQTTLDTFICPGTSVPMENMEVASTGCDSIITLNPLELPMADAGMDRQTCDPEFQLNALPPAEGVSGVWTSNTGSVSFSDATDPTAFAFDLALGQNEFQWTLSYPGCPEYSSDILTIRYTDGFGNLNAANDAYELDESGQLAANVLDNDDYPNTELIRVRLIDNNQVAGEAQLDSVGNLSFRLDEEANLLNIGLLYRIEYRDCPDVFSDAGISITLADDVVSIPLVFTPNGDGVNDFFVIPELDETPDEFPSNSLTVINRWGDVVYQSKPYNNDWDGKHYQNNKMLPAGTYFCIIRLNVAEGLIRTEMVTLIR